VAGFWSDVDTEKFRKFLHEEKYLKLKPSAVWSQPMGMYVGGYSSSADEHEMWQFSIQTDGSSSPTAPVASAGHGGISFGGQTEAVTRSLLGFDGTLPNVLKTELGDATKADQLVTATRKLSERSLLWDAMPVQDAIDLADYLVDATKGFVRFQVGHDTVGGETDIAVVTKFEGFKWVRRKHYFPTSLNPQGIQPPNGGAR
jgi:hypothetical protein